MARGSLVEIETQLQIAMNLTYLAKAEGTLLMRSAAELGRILNGLLSSIKLLRSFQLCFLLFSEN
jgi:four helix bundle protein